MAVVVTGSSMSTFAEREALKRAAVSSERFPSGRSKRMANEAKRT